MSAPGSPKVSSPSLTDTARFVDPTPINLAPASDLQREFSYPKSKIKIVLLEGIHKNAVALFEEQGWQIDAQAGALLGDDLVARLQGAHMVGVRSKTKLTADVLSKCPKLKAVGCFCIGTDQTNLDVAEAQAVPVFNSPFSNSRSVAELVISHVISLSRRVPDHIRDMHSNVWNKTATGCNEIRGKTLGIVGYGHIGTQLGVLAEAMGMRVIFFDILNIMPLGNSVPVDSLEQLLAQADYVTLHVPNTPETQNMITAKELGLMKKGSYLLNLSRGRVVDLDALAAALNGGHVAGAAVDVYPVEPAKNGPMDVYPEVKIPLQGCKNCILTPHIGGSTEEAQAAIGTEVAMKLIRYINLGSTESAVNFPQVTPALLPRSRHRVLHAHKNVPGVLRKINDVISDLGNIASQLLATSQSTGYLVVDVDVKAGDNAADKMREVLSGMDETIACRVLY